MNIVLTVTVNRIDGKGGGDHVAEAVIDSLAGTSVDVEDDEGRESVWEVEDAVEAEL